MGYEVIHNRLSMPRLGGIQAEAVSDAFSEDSVLAACADVICAHITGVGPRLVYGGGIV